VQAIPESSETVLKSRMKKLNALFDAAVRRRIHIECDSIPYRFENVSPRKILNWLRVEISARLRARKSWGTPTHLQIEPTNRCNLKCELCPVSGQMSRPSGFMDANLYRKLLDDIGAQVFLILLWDWGEPFMHPLAFELISEAHQRRIQVVSSTNGHLFTDEQKADRAIRSGLDTLIFAIDGISQKTYEEYRHQGSLQQALEGVRTIVRRKRTLGSKTPLVNFRFIVMKHNEHEVKALPVLARELGVDALTLKTLNPCSNNTYGDKADDSSGRMSPLLPENSQYRRFIYDSSGNPKRLDRNACRNPWNAATVHWNGTVCPCTYDYDERYVMGDLKRNSFWEIWNGPPYREFRDRLRREDKTHYFCHECSYAHIGGSCIDETVRKAIFFNHRDEA
jgi:radical SAM protein with 4Fe4S-binding SPASM domain